MNFAMENAVFEENRQRITLASNALLCRSNHIRVISIISKSQSAKSRIPE